MQRPLKSFGYPRRKFTYPFSALLSVSVQSQEECIRRILPVLLSCISMSAIWQSSKLGMSKLVERLQPSVADGRESVHIATIRSRLWTSLIAAFGAEDNYKTREWFSTQGTIAATPQNINNYAELDEVLGCYLFFQSLHDDPLDKLRSRLVTLANNEGKTSWS